MGLTVCYDWKVKADLAAARRLIKLYHDFARALPFDELTEIFEQDSPDESLFTPYEDSFRLGSLYLPRKREDGAEESVRTPALHAVFFFVRVEGAETATIGLASHAPVVIHREDLIERDSDGKERGRRLGQGDPIEFPTHRRGYYSWQSGCKTQYAGNPKLGGEANFLRAHLTLIELFDQIEVTGAQVRIHDDSKYAQHRDVDRLLASLRDWNAIVAHFAGKIGDVIKDATGDESVAMHAPIQDRPDFEHLEAKGIDVLRKLAAAQQNRKKNDSSDLE